MSIQTINNNESGFDVRSKLNSNFAELSDSLTVVSQASANWDANVTFVQANSASWADAADWNSISNKPATFDPSAHTHAVADVTDLQAALDVKADATTVASVSSELDSKIDSEAGALASDISALNTTVQATSSTLEGMIDDEAAARAAADSAIETTLASVSASLAGDVASVNDRVDNVLSNVDPAALDSLTEVVGAFQAADSDLNGAITALAGSASTNLATVSSTLQSQIDLLDSGSSASVTTLSAELKGDISSEAVARAAADSAINTTVASVSSTLNTKIDSRSASLSSSVDSLQSYVNTNFLNLTGGVVNGSIHATGTVTAAGGLEISTGSALDETTLFAGGGKIGIGTESPNEKLTVVGNVSATGRVFVAEPVESNSATTKGYVTSLVSGEVSTLNTTVASVSSTLQTSIDGKANTSHSHAIADVTGLQTALDGKQASGNFATSTTVASVSATLAGRIDNVISNTDSAALDSLTEVVGAFQAADNNLNNAITALAGSASTNLASVSATLKSQIDGKANTSHSHAIADVTGLQSALDAKSATTVLASVSSTLQTAIDSKQASGNFATSTTLAAVSAVLSAADASLQTQINGKANTSHSHAIADVTNLQTSLDAKANTTTLASYLPLSGGSLTGAFNVTSGNVGVGTSTPFAKLTVVGDISATGDVVAFSTSDERLKNNIVEIPNALEKISVIRGVQYVWNTELQTTHSGQDVGVIAQEVESVLPTAVIDRDNGYKAVKYEKLIPLLIESVKDLKIQVYNLTTTVKSLQK